MRFSLLHRLLGFQFGCLHLAGVGPLLKRGVQATAPSKPSSTLVSGSLVLSAVSTDFEKSNATHTHTQVVIRASSPRTIQC